MVTVTMLDGYSLHVYKNVNPCFQYKNNNRICKTEILSDKEKVNLIYASEVAMFL